MMDRVVLMRMNRMLMLCEGDQGEEDGAGDSGCGCDGDWPQGATASSSMIPRIRLYTASGKCLKKKKNVGTRSPQAHKTRRDVPLSQSFEQGDRAIAVTVAQFSAEHGFPCRRLAKGY